MGKLKGFYKNNRIYCIMMAISIFCIALIGVAFLVYFINQTKTDAYGDRLNGIENVNTIDIKTDYSNMGSSPTRGTTVRKINLH